MARDRFLQGAMILAAAGFAVKVLGSVNRILLSRLLGGEGIGLYQMAYPLYVLIQAIAYAGIPAAISILVSGYAARQDFAGVRRVFKLSFAFTVALGLLLAGGFWALASWLSASGILQDGRAYLAMLALVPAVFFCIVLASFRGFFQGLQLMTAPATAQIAEQLIRISAMLTFAFLLLPYGLEYAAAGAAFAAVPGSIAGFIALCFFYRHYKKSWQGDTPQIKSRDKAGFLLKRIILLALPVSCANILVPVTSGIDMLLVPARLCASGFSVSEATTLYGYLAGMAQPLLLLATIPTGALAASLVPAVVEAMTLDMAQVRAKASLALKLCCLVTLPASIGMSLLAPGIALLLYGTEKAGTALMHTGPALFLLGLQQITAALLQGMGHTAVPMLNMLVGITVKTAGVLLLVSASFNVAGAAWATNLGFAAAALLNIFALGYYKVLFCWYNVLKIFAASLMMGLAAYALTFALDGVFSQMLATAAAIIFAVLVYLALLLIMKIVTSKELGQLLRLSGPAKRKGDT